MSGDITKALKRREELRRELADLDRLIQLYEQYVGPVDVSRERIGHGERPEESDSVPVRKTGAPARVADAAESILRRMDRPIQRGELAKLIEESGVEIPSDDKPRYLGTVLWRRGDRFENIEGEGYIVKDAPRRRSQPGFFGGDEPPARKINLDIDGNGETG